MENLGNLDHEDFKFFRKFNNKFERKLRNGMPRRLGNDKRMPANEVSNLLQQNKNMLIDITAKEIASYPEYFKSDFDLSKLNELEEVRPRRGITFIAKVTHACNLNCPYCYDVKYRKSMSAEENLMTIDIVKKILDIFATGDHKIHMWIWHGGEPLLVSTKFYYEANDLILSYDKSIQIAMQSNGLLTTDENLDMLSKYNIRPGLSFDGMNNHLTRNNTPALMMSMRKLETRGLLSGAIHVITNDSIENIIEEYEYSKRLGVPTKMNLIFSALDNDKSYSLDGEKAAKYICKLFDYWIKDRDDPIYSDILNRYITAAFDNGGLCTQVDCAEPAGWFSAQPNGDLYNCGRDWTSKEDIGFGNIMEMNSYEDVINHPNRRKWSEGTRNLQNKCSPCELFYSCHGGCFLDAYLADRTFNTPDINGCIANKLVIPHIIDKILGLKYSDYPSLNPRFVDILLEVGYRPSDILESAFERAKEVANRPADIEAGMKTLLNGSKEDLQ